MSEQITFLNKKENQEILEKLKEQFGIQKIPGILTKRNEDRLFLVTGDITENQIKELEKITFIERVGFYFAKREHNKEGKEEIRLSIEGSQILSDQITKNIFELENSEQMEQWMSGQELLIKTGKREFLVMKYKGNFLGTGKASENKISNFIPKNRRLKLRTTIK
ncbi:hypothetical protein J4474_02720 [Candidatus Pacearchaeota archaeon]|nr:hypothetical protein [Candidatus Pacearchaeota archaeon]